VLWSAAVFDTLFLAPVIAAVTEALAAAGIFAGHGLVAVVGQPRLARALAERGHRVLAVGDAKALARLKRHNAVHDTAEQLKVEDRSLTALVGWGGDDAVVDAWVRGVVDGGALVMIDRAAATEASRRALCAGLVELQQRPAGRLVVTSGLVSAL